MIPVLNDIGVHCAVLGNHDFGKIKSDFLFWYLIQLLVKLFVKFRSWVRGNNGAY